MVEWLEEIGIGLAAGFLSGLTGVGGGIIMIPLLVSLIHLDQRVAQGTSLLTFSMPVLALAARRYWREGRASVRAALGIAMGIIPSSIFSAHLAQGIPIALLRHIFGAFILIVGAYQLWQNLRRMHPKESPSRKPLWAWGFLGGLIAGTLSGLTGIGGGVVLVPYLVWVVRLDQHTAQGTSLLTLSLPVLAAAAYPYYRSGNVLPLAALGLGLGLILGSLISARLAQKIHASCLAMLFSLFLMSLGVYFLFRRT